MATRKAADHTLYHLNPKGFWKKFRASVRFICAPQILKLVALSQEMLLW